jgi:hypothetical protein
MPLTRLPLVHLVLVYWVYRDALWRYNRGAPWALMCMVLPFAGWGFYLLYRHSPLVEFDRIDAELFDEDFIWTDYDTYKRTRARFFADPTQRSGAAKARGAPGSARATAT